MREEGSRKGAKKRRTKEREETFNPFVFLFFAPPA
jgi:hypothetical protein